MESGGSYRSDSPIHDSTRPHQMDAHETHNERTTKGARGVSSHESRGARIDRRSSHVGDCEV
ncbi:hypothetical protein J1N35_012448 [Gossypium stocksii]|uniref:Uncharacterized protein n=1 Tax=Gossypium stocksii TaxID=47602 RepID=A0A9D3W655_9ROSI|nr:hypothetical protein J1N35_012448 [Gossypium stocksii]